MTDLGTYPLAQNQAQQAQQHAHITAEPRVSPGKEEAATSEVGGQQHDGQVASDGDVEERYVEVVFLRGEHDAW